MTAVKACVCRNEFQDKQHGPGQRVHNASTKGWRCTSCGMVKETSETAAMLKGSKSKQQ